MPTYRLTIEYDGTRYRGWQEQKNARTVAGELRAAIERVAGRIEDLGGSGRTDAGVHAAAQTAHLRLARAMDCTALRYAINDLLPADVHVLSVVPAHERFHARHTAILRSYVYQIAVRRTAFAKRFVWWVKRPLDPGLMGQAARAVAGRHDFALFCEKPADQTSTIVVVENTEVAAAEGLILVRIVASHFLWRMVRRVVGALVEVGAGDLDPAVFRSLLEDAGAIPPADLRPALWTAPPSGLFLERALYPGDPPLAALGAIVPVSAEPRAAAGAAGVKAPEDSKRRGDAADRREEGRAGPTPRERSQRPHTDVRRRHRRPG